jgi:hypothetical protein
MEYGKGQIEFGPHAKTRRREENILDAIDTIYRISIHFQWQMANRKLTDQHFKTGFERHEEQGPDPIADETLAGPLEDLVIPGSGIKRRTTFGQFVGHGLAPISNGKGQTENWFETKKVPDTFIYPSIYNPLVMYVRV